MVRRSGLAASHWWTAAWAVAEVLGTERSASRIDWRSAFFSGEDW